ncbi:MAG: alpha-amylase family glycosyl hydrolase [Bacteroidota bacterium]|nr:alpha-amylase family glycosyl hydrolase [Bacteroidota bacterium]
MNSYLFGLIIILISCTQKGREVISVAPEWAKTSRIYEMIPSEFSSNGKLEGIISRLSHLNKLFINTVVFLPVQTLDRVDNNYNPQSYFALKDFQTIDTSLGDALQFQKLIDSLHSKKTSVLLSIHIGETGPNHPWRKSSPQFYVSQETMKESNYNPDYIKLNLNDKKLQKELFNILKFWVKNFKLNGFVIYGTKSAPADFILDLLNEFSLKNNHMIILDHIIEKEPNGYYGYLDHELYHFFEQMEKDSVDVSSIKDHLKKINGKLPKAIPVFYSQNALNHDLHGPEVTYFSQTYKTNAYITELFPGIPFICNGQEEPLYQKINRFDQIGLDFKYNFMLDVFRSAHIQRMANPALQSADLTNFPEIISDSQDVLAFERKHGNAIIVSFINLKNSSQKFTIKKDYYYYSDLKTKVKVHFIKDQPYTLGPYQVITITNII